MAIYCLDGIYHISQKYDNILSDLNLPHGATCSTWQLRTPMAEYYASGEDNDDAENDVVYDPDAVDLRRLAAEARAGPLQRAVQAKRQELKGLIEKALAEQRREREGAGEKQREEDADDPDDLVLGLLSVWVDEVPEYGEELLARHRASLNRHGENKGARRKSKNKNENESAQNGGQGAPALQDGQAVVEDAGAGGLAQDDSPLATGMTALLLATASERESSVNCVHALLEAGADADARQPLTLAGPLHLACLSSIRGGGAAPSTDASAGQWSRTRKRHSGGNTAGADDGSGLPSAASIAKKAAKRALRHIDVATSIVLNKIEMLCACGAEVNATDTALLTPLHAACLAGQPSPVIARLIALGADPNLQDKAILVGKRRADPTHSGDVGWTPLHHLAAGIAYSEDSVLAAAMELLEAGADPSIRARWMSCDVDGASRGDGTGARGDGASGMSLTSGRGFVGGGGHEPIPQRAPELLYPDEVASRLGKKALAELLQRPRKELQAQQALAREEAARKESARVARLGYLRGVIVPYVRDRWHDVSRSTKTGAVLLVALLVGFVGFARAHMAMAAGAAGAMAVLAALGLIAVKREAWVESIGGGSGSSSSSRYLSKLD